MKILLTHPSAELYGSDRMALVTLRALVRGGHTVSAVVPTDGPLTGLMTQAGARVTIADTAVLRKSDLSRGFVALLRNVVRSFPTIVRTIREADPGVLYVNTLVQPWWLVAAKLSRQPVVVHVREAEEQANIVVRLLLYLPLLIADLVVCNSQATHREIVAVLPALAKKACVIYNGKDWSAYRKQQAPGTTGSGGRSRVCLTVVGRLSPRKGQDVAIRALAELVRAGHDSELTFVGSVFPGYEWYEEALKKESAALGVVDRVRFLGFLPDFGTVLSETDIAIVPSRVEPFGTVAAECMAAGVVTIVADVQGLTEIVVDGRNGLTFPVDDHHALAERCMRAISDVPGAMAMASTGRRDVNERFGLARYEREIVRAIERTGTRRP